MSLTPHGPAFSFLDAFEIILPGREGRGRKWLDPALPFFADHFPGRPLMPGVLLVECAAQAAGALWASMASGNATKPFSLAQITQFKIQHAVLPGETVETRVILERDFESLAQFETTLTVGGREVAWGRLVLGRATGASA